jgi:acetyl-CoA carboxylase biotin carboxylase subunit
VQRRHQKLFEEAPSRYLNAEQRRSIGEKAVAAARAAGYVGAGTIEFISETPDKTYFMEMNTRIQVEHPVTEMITGKDLIALQIRVAEGEKLPFCQDDLQIHGWAMEARINAEDPARDFAPGPGLVTSLELPHGPGIRVDTHLYAGYRIPDAYDSMVAKVISWGETREQAAARLKRALSELRIKGVPTTARFHEALLAHPAFGKGDLTTRFIEDNGAYWEETLKGKSKTPLPDSQGLAALAAVLTQDAASPAAATVKAGSLWRKAAAAEGQA